MLKSPLKSSLEEIKPLMVPDMYALQHMKALQETNPALKALVDARGKFDRFDAFERFLYFIFIYFLNICVEVFKKTICFVFLQPNYGIWN